MTEQLPIDVSILERARESITRTQLAFENAHNAYVTALEIAMAAIIRMTKTQGAPDAVAQYERAMAGLIVMRRNADDAQIERVNGESIYAPLVRLITEELVTAVNTHSATLIVDRRDIDRQQKYINEAHQKIAECYQEISKIRDALERSNQP